MTSLALPWAGQQGCLLLIFKIFKEYVCYPLKHLSIYQLVFTVSCSKNNNSLSESRTFEFTYQVSLEPPTKS